MLLFKEILSEAFEDPLFKEFYDNECHVCFGTMKLIEAMENAQVSVPKILEICGMTEQSYEDLKNGDSCDPQFVRKLYAALGIPELEILKACRRLRLCEPE